MFKNLSCFGGDLKKERKNEKEKTITKVIINDSFSYFDEMTLDYRTLIDRIQYLQNKIVRDNN